VQIVPPYEDEIEIDGVYANGKVVLLAPHTHTVMCIVISFCVCIATSYPVACVFRDLTTAPHHVCYLRSPTRKAWGHYNLQIHFLRRNYSWCVETSPLDRSVDKPVRIIHAEAHDSTAQSNLRSHYKITADVLKRHQLIGRTIHYCTALMTLQRMTRPLGVVTRHTRVQRRTSPVDRSVD